MRPWLLWLERVTILDRPGASEPDPTHAHEGKLFLVGFGASDETRRLGLPPFWAMRAVHSHQESGGGPQPYAYRP